LSADSTSMMLAADRALPARDHRFLKPHRLQERRREMMAVLAQAELKEGLVALGLGPIEIGVGVCAAVGFFDLQIKRVSCLVGIHAHW
jgi:hypothetical protein